MAFNHCNNGNGWSNFIDQCAGDQYICGVVLVEAVRAFVRGLPCRCALICLYRTPGTEENNCNTCSQTNERDSITK